MVQTMNRLVGATSHCPLAPKTERPSRLAMDAFGADRPGAKDGLAWLESGAGVLLEVSSWHGSGQPSGSSRCLYLVMLAPCTTVLRVSLPRLQRPPDGSHSAPTGSHSVRLSSVSEQFRQAEENVVVEKPTAPGGRTGEVQQRCAGTLAADIESAPRSSRRDSAPSARSATKLTTKTFVTQQLFIKQQLLRGKQRGGGRQQ